MSQIIPFNKSVKAVTTAGYPWTPWSASASTAESHLSPARQAVVSIHFSSCPAPSSPWWFAWQGRMDWHICTATGPDPFFRPFSLDPSVSNVPLDQFWSMRPRSKRWSVEITGGQLVSLLSRPMPGDLNSGQLGRSVGPCDVCQAEYLCELQDTVFTHTQTHTLHTHTDTHTHTHTLSHTTHTHTDTHTDRQTHTYRHTHTHTQTRTHAHTHTLSHTQTHTHTHTCATVAVTTHGLWCNSHVCFM